MHKRKWLLLLPLLLALVALCAPAALAAEEAEIRLQATEPDADGDFQLRMTITNASFNVFSMALRYDPQTVQPTDDKGAATTTFARFATDSPDWLSTIGTAIDDSAGLISFTGYVTPGQAPVSDGLTPETGVATLGATGQQVFTFHFRQLGQSPVKLELAVAREGQASDPFLPQGGSLLDAGEELPFTCVIDLPQSVGESSTQELPGTESQPSVTAPGSATASSGTIISGQTVTDPQTKTERAQDAILLQIGNYAAVVDGALVHIYPGEKKVTPYLEPGENRTYVPVRFVAERLGATVDWDNDTQTAVISSGGQTIRMTVGSRTYTVNGESRTMDASARLMASSEGYARTMVPIRFVAEALGRDVSWDQDNQLVIIAPAAAPWNAQRTAEQELTADALLLLSPLMRDFVTDLP